MGKGYVGVPGTGVGEPGPGEMMLYGGTGVKTSLWAGGIRAVTITTGGYVGIGTTSPLATLDAVGVSGFAAVRGRASTGTTGAGVEGSAETGSGVYGSNKSTSLNSQNAGIVGLNNTGGWAGYFFGPVKVTGDCTGCSPPSDRNLKTNISSVNPRLILDKLVSVPVQTWNYKSEPQTVRHIGVMAQDFRAAFGLGDSDRTLNTVDAQGVTMASIQALYQLMLEKDRQNQELARKVERLEAQLNQVRRNIRGKRAAKR